MSLIKLIESGDIFGAVKKVGSLIKELLGILPAPIKAWVEKFLSDEGVVLLAAAEAGAKDILAGKSMADAATDVVNTLATQGITVAKNDAMDAVRTQLNYLQSLQPTPEAV